MEGFKNNTKMQCFKEGGQVKYESRKEHKEEMSADIKQDKAIVKKAIGMHDKQEHPGEKTDLSKLRKGGRAKKDCGTVKKYKAGGNVTNVYEAKKKSGDLDNIKKVKQIAPTKANASSAAGKGDNTSNKFKNGGRACYNEGGSLKEVDAPNNPGLAKLPTSVRNKMGYMRHGGNVSETNKKAGDKDATVRVKATGDKKADAKMFACGGRATAPSAPVNQSMGTFNKKRGGKIKKMADGGMTNPMTDASALLNPIRSAGTALRNNVMGTPEQNRIAQARMDMIAAKKKAAEQAALLGGLGGGAALQQGAMAGQTPTPAPMPTPMATTPAVPAPAGVPMQKRGGKVKKC
jgi:hypothetical protein